MVSVILVFPLNLYLVRKYKGNDPISWVILGFTDINYSPVTKLWYERLSEVGYDNHIIVALDNSSFKNITIKSKYRCEKGAGELQEIGFKNVVKLRLASILKHLEKGKNVFVSDVDTYWNFFFDLHKLPIHYDIFMHLAQHGLLKFSKNGDSRFVHVLQVTEETQKPFNFSVKL